VRHLDKMPIRVGERVFGVHYCIPCKLRRRRWAWMAPDMTPNMSHQWAAVYVGRREPSQSRARGSFAVLRPKNGNRLGKRRAFLRGDEGFGRFLGVETPDRQAVSCSGTVVVQRYHPDAVSNVVEQGQSGNDMIISRSEEVRLRDIIRLLRKASSRKAAL